MFITKTIFRLLRSTLYRTRVLGHANIPVDGPVLIAANHMSVIDALFIQAAMRRPVHFLMSQDVYDTALVRKIAPMLNIIAVSEIGGGKQDEAFAQARKVLNNGGVVCVHGVGKLTRGGHELSLEDTLEALGNIGDAPVVAAHVDRLLGPVYNFRNGRYRFRRPPSIPYVVTVSFSSAQRQGVTPESIRRGIQREGTRAYMDRPLKRPILSRAFHQVARRHPKMMAMADARIPHMPYYQALAGSIAFARKLNKLLDDRPMVGLLLPPSVGGGLANIALQFMGKVAVNLNYTSSAESMASCAKQCDIKYVLTSKAFLEKLPMEVPGEPIYLEDVRASVTKGDRLKALLLGFLCPTKRLERILGAPANRSPQDLATIIFSSGSTGDPKGIMLSHYNISSNIEGVLHVFPYDKGDGMMSILPFFHSFGFTGTGWLPLNRAFGVIFHPNPLEAKPVGEFIHKYGPKFFVATPTFLQTYIRRCLPEELASLVYVVTGAEKLPERVRQAFKNKFGPEPLEGYGTTECAPVVSVNVPDLYTPGFHLAGTRHGTIGLPLPGISVRIMDPDTGEPLPEGQAGLLYVKGPNIMQGYLNQEELTAEVLQDGWYNTGDIASLDEDGFITITDRLSRFSKIAGEMVPHHKVEDTLHSLLELTEQRLAVVGVPDANKGEQLVVLHTLEDGELENLTGKLGESGLPNLWTPRVKNFYRIEEIPVLGTGKMDLRQLKSIAKDLALSE